MCLLITLDNHSWVNYFLEIVKCSGLVPSAGHKNQNLLHSKYFLSTWDLLLSLRHIAIFILWRELDPLMHFAKLIQDLSFKQKITLPLE